MINAFMENFADIKKKYEVTKYNFYKVVYNIYKQK